MQRIGDYPRKLSVYGVQCKEGIEAKQRPHKWEYVRRISVRTLTIRFTTLAFMLVLSTVPPKEGDCGLEPQPTIMSDRSAHRNVEEGNNAEVDIGH